MSYIKSLPKTRFILPDNSVIESVDILKSVVFSKRIKENTTISKSIFYDNISRIENLSYDNYSNNLSLYWIVVLHNNILSFSDIPKQQIRFESEFNINNQGTVYYIKNAINAIDIKNDDLLLMQTNANWKYGGIVKEYEPNFRRIVLKKEFENVENEQELEDQTMYIYRKINNSSSYSLIKTETLERGRVEKEKNKVIKIFEQGSTNQEISPFMKISGDEIGYFDFSDSPSEDTVIYKLCNDTLTNYKLYSNIEEQLYINSSKKNLKFFSTGTAFSISAFFKNLITKNPERGKEIDLSS